MQSIYKQLSQIRQNTNEELNRNTPVVKLGNQIWREEVNHNLFMGANAWFGSKSC